MCSIVRSPLCLLSFCGRRLFVFVIFFLREDETYGYLFERVLWCVKEKEEKERHSNEEIKMTVLL